MQLPSNNAKDHFLAGENRRRWVSPKLLLTTGGNGRLQRNWGCILTRHECAIAPAAGGLSVSRLCSSGTERAERRHPRLQLVLL